MALQIILFVILSYLLGSIPSGLIIGKVLRKIDIREHGSKNTGATNAVRVLGFRYGVWAFVFDAVKGAFVILILRIFKLTDLYLFNNGNLDISIIYGFFAVLGHVFPIYVSFKGGKAVATSAGVVTAIEPITCLVALLTFLIAFLKTRYVSISSTLAAGLVFLVYVLRILFHSNLSLATYFLELGVAACLGALILFRHRSNYKRLKEGTENRF